MPMNPRDLFFGNRCHLRHLLYILVSLYIGLWDLIDGRRFAKYGTWGVGVV